MSARAKSPPGKGKGKVEATPEELAAAEAARLGGALAAAEAAKAAEASDRNYAQLERVRRCSLITRPNSASAMQRASRPAASGAGARGVAAAGVRCLRQGFR